MMDSWSILNIILTASTFPGSIVSGIASFGIMLLVFLFHRHTKSIPILLVCHTSFVIFCTQIFLSNIALSSLYGFIGIRMKNHGDTNWCHWCTFFYRSGLCALFDSYILQGLFRIFRVVLYRHKYLHSFQLYCIILPFALMFSVLSMSPLIIRDGINYLPSAYYCDISVLNIPNFGYFFIRIYIFPLVFLCFVYLFLLRYIRRPNALSIPSHIPGRARSNVRDLTVIKRLLLTMLILIFLGFPGTCLLVYFYITGNLFASVYHLTWLSVSLGTIFLSYFLVMFTKPLKDTTVQGLVRHFPCLHRRVEPMPAQKTREELVITNTQV